MDTQVVTGMKLVVRTKRFLEAGRINWLEDELGGRPCLEDLEDEEESIVADLDLDLPQLALELFVIDDTLIHEQQGTVELQQLARQHGRLVEMLMRQKRLHEVRRQQVEVRLE